MVNLKTKRANFQNRRPAYKVTDFKNKDHLDGKNRSLTVRRQGCVPVTLVMNLLYAPSHTSHLERLMSLPFSSTPLSRVLLTLLALLGLSPAQAATTPAAADADWVYMVKPGDTLSNISQTYLISTQKWPGLQKQNKIGEPKQLTPGTQLRLPVALLKREAVEAEVLHLQGPVTRTPLKGTTQALDKATRLQTGDTIDTGVDATISIKFIDGSRLLLTPKSRLVLSEMVILGKSGVAQTVMELQQGALDTQVAKQSPTAGRYEVKSRAVNLAVRGTDFRASVDPTDQVGRSEVLEGAVQASAAGTPVLVPAGFGTSAVPGQPASAPVPLLSAPDLSGVDKRIERVPLRFQWASLTGAARYRAQVFADKTFERLLLDGVFPTPSAKWTDLPDGRYVLRVRGIDQGGLEGLNADQEFVLKARPEAPFVSAPVEGAKSYGPATPLRWSNSLVAQAYHVQVSTQADFSNLLADLPSVTGTEYSVPLEPGKYHWRVASIAAGADHGPFGDPQSFTQRKIPDSPQTEAPSMDEKHLNFRWRASDAGVKYQLQLANEPGFGKPVVDRVLTENQVQLDRPAPGIYFMRIKTIDPDGFAGPFGTPQQIDVPDSPKPWRFLPLLLPLLL